MRARAIVRGRLGHDGEPVGASVGAQRFESSAAGHRSVWPTSAWAAPHSNRYAPTASPAPRSSRFAGRSGDRSDSRSGNDTRTSLPRSVGILSSWGSSAAGDPPQLGILRSWDPPLLGSSAAGILWALHLHPANRDDRGAGDAVGAQRFECGAAQASVGQAERCPAAEDSKRCAPTEAPTGSAS